MDKTLYPTSNRAEGTLLADINASQLTVVLNSGEGAEFPTGTNGTADSAGTANALNSTGIDATAIVVGDFIRNVTDGSYAVVRSIAAGVVTTTDLQGGSDNTWEDTDEYTVGSFIVSINNRDASGNVTKIELMKVKYCNNSANTLYIETGGRGFGGTSAQSFTSATHYASLFVTADTINAMQDMIAQGVVGVDELKNNPFTKKGVQTFDEFPVLPTANPVSDYQAVHKKFMLENAGGGGEVTKELAGTCSAGDRLYITGAGKFAKATDAGEIQATILKAGNYPYIWCEKIDTDMWVMVYSTGAACYAQVGNFDGSGNWVGGTEVNFYNSSSIDYVSACKLTDGTGVILVKQASTIRLFHFTTAGTTMTIGTAQTGHSGVHTAARKRFKIIRLTDTTYAFGSSNDAANNIGFCVGSESSGVLSTGTFQTHNTTASRDAYPGDLCRIDDTHLYYGSYSADGVNATRCKVYDVSNKNAKVQTAPASGFYSIGSSNGNAWGQIENIDPANGVVMHIGYGSAARGMQVVTPTTITNKAAPAITAESSTMKNDTGLTKISTNKFVITQDDGTVDFHNTDSAQAVTSLGTMPSVGTAAFGAEEGSSGIPIIANTGSNVEAISASYDRTTGAKFLANEAQTNGNQLKGIGVGGILTAETGLTAGEIYTIAGEEWGIATAATDVFITKT